MDLALHAGFLIVLLLLFLAGGLWVAMSLLAIGLVGMVLFSNAPAGSVMATTVWGSSASWTLTALPLFIWMGEILYRSRLSEDMFHGLAPWLTRLPGRLMHVNIFGCGVFGAAIPTRGSNRANVGQHGLKGSCAAKFVHPATVFLVRRIVDAIQMDEFRPVSQYASST